jgi:hypothetical protein
LHFLAAVGRAAELAAIGAVLTFKGYRDYLRQEIPACDRECYRQND